MNSSQTKPNKTVGITLVICIAILVVAVVGFIGLRSMKTPPPRKVLTERPVKVETIVAKRTSLPVLLKGHGELHPYRTVTLAAEVAGTITSIHPHLREGKIIQQGELLFSIDEEDFQTDYIANKERLEILTTDLALARSELKRVQKLFEQNKVGSIAEVETKQRAVNSAADRLALVRQAMQRAEINLARCRVTAPFTCRVLSRKIETGQYVSPGMMAVEIADDSILEVTFPIYGKDAVQWLELVPTPPADGSWFIVPEESLVTIRWTESPTASFEGILHRVHSYDSATRSLRLVARLGSQKPAATALSPVAGMFVSVQVPGKVMEDVFALPRTAVSFENTVHIVRDNRLFTIPVQVVRSQEDAVYVRDGLSEGDQIITTRLINPLESTLVEIINKDGASS